MAHGGKKFTFCPVRPFRLLFGFFKRPPGDDQVSNIMEHDQPPQNSPVRIFDREVGYMKKGLPLLCGDLDLFRNRPSFAPLSDPEVRLWDQTHQGTAWDNLRLRTEDGLGSGVEIDDSSLVIDKKNRILHVFHRKAPRRWYDIKKTVPEKRPPDNQIDRCQGGRGRIEASERQDAKIEQNVQNKNTRKSCNDDDRLVTIEGFRIPERPDKDPEGKDDQGVAVSDVKRIPWTFRETEHGKGLRQVHEKVAPNQGASCKRQETRDHRYTEKKKPASPHQPSQARMVEGHGEEGQGDERYGGESKGRPENLVLQRQTRYVRHIEGSPENAKTYGYGKSPGHREITEPDGTEEKDKRYNG